ncbi:MAG: zf-HC2 domain-containing protein [Candidatus Sericytochromatia bacterium]|nr:zf-HC2 domain-containing protein [Candidatus Sericytochromatia bacterium]
MRCSEAEVLFSDWQDGLLGEDEAKQLERHLRECVSCCEREEGLRALAVCLRQLPAVEPPVGLEARIFSALAASESDEVRVPSPKRASGFVLECNEAQDAFTGALEETLVTEDRLAFEHHLASCDACRKAFAQFVSVVQLLAKVTPVPVPEDLAERILNGLRQVSRPVGGRASRTTPARAVKPRWNHFLSGLVGAAATAAAVFVWSYLPGVGVPKLEARAVPVSQDVAVHIQFEADERLDGVVFQVDLPEGLKFIDDSSSPLLAQSVSWRGALEKGKTVVPIVVRGTRPGNYTIEAVVRKGPLIRRTTVVLPVEG